MIHLALAAILTQPPAVDPGAWAVVLSGQSNAVSPARTLPEDRLIPEPGVVVLSRDGHWRDGAEPYGPPPAGVSFGRTLARRLIETGAAPQVWLATCAVGMTTARSWAWGNAMDPVMRANGGALYSRCQLQGQMLRRLGVRVVAVAWHQGESGCGSPVLSAEHEGLMRTIVGRFRADFPGVVFVAGELAEATPCAYKERIHDALRVTADALVSSAGLTTIGGGVHFDRPSLRVLGERYADAILGLAP